MQLQGWQIKQLQGVELPIIDEDKIGTVIMKRYNVTVQLGEVSYCFDYEQLNFIVVYINGKNEKICFRQLDQCTCNDTDWDTMRQITKNKI